MSAGSTNVVGRRVLAFVIDLILVLAAWTPVFLALAKSAPAPSTVGPGPGLAPPGVGTPPGFPSSGVSAHALVQVTIGGRERYATGGTAVLLIVVLIALVVVVFALLAAWARGTPGMLLLGLRVIGEDGGRVGVGRQLVRTAMWTVDAFPYLIPGLTGFLFAAGSSRHQRLGDRVARTLVVARRR